MSLHDRIPLGLSLPHRSPDPIDPASVRRVAERAEALGFRELWVTENTLDHVTSFDPIELLTYVAALTSRIRLGVSVVVLPVHHPIGIAHRIATLDRLSGGRAILGVGLGHDAHYDRFQVPRDGRVLRFREGVALIRALWTEPTVDYRGSVFRLDGAGIGCRPVQVPHPPIWLGGGHPAALRRAARIADGWMGAGGSSHADFARSVPLLRAALEADGRDPATYPISKRVFLAVDEDRARARAELERWFTLVYRNPAGTDAAGLCGTPDEVRAGLEALVAAGANHLLLNPVARWEEQVEMLAAVVGLA